MTSEQWEKIHKKYGNLMYKISYQISGDDKATSAFDDNLQDIRLAAMEAVIGFEKQNGGANGKFDDFWGSKGFDQYIKTCMWTKKNNKGAKITKKAPILRGTVSSDLEKVLEIPACTGDPDISALLEEIAYRLTAAQQKIITLVVKDPTFIKPSGRMNVKRLAENMELTWFETSKQIKNLSIILQNEL
jgi:hypothetical protein